MNPSGIAQMFSKLRREREGDHGKIKKNCNRETWEGGGGGEERLKICDESAKPCHSVPSHKVACVRRARPSPCDSAALVGSTGVVRSVGQQESRRSKGSVENKEKKNKTQMFSILSLRRTGKRKWPTKLKSKKKKRTPFAREEDATLRLRRNRRPIGSLVGGGVERYISRFFTISSVRSPLRCPPLFCFLSWAYLSFFRAKVCGRLAAAFWRRASRSSGIVATCRVSPFRFVSARRCREGGDDAHARARMRVGERVRDDEVAIDRSAAFPSRVFLRSSDLGKAYSSARWQIRAPRATTKKKGRTSLEDDVGHASLKIPFFPPPFSAPPHFALSRVTFRHCCSRWFFVFLPPFVLVPVVPFRGICNATGWCHNCWKQGK